MGQQSVFEKMKSYYLSNGKVMPDSIFVSIIVKKHQSDEIVKGVLDFNHYLDEQRREAS